MNKVQVQIGQLAKSVNERQKGMLPSQPLPNPKNHFPLHEVEDMGPSQCNSIHTLRSGKRVDNKVSNQSSKSMPKPTPPVPVTPTPDNQSSSSEPLTSKDKGKEKVDEQPYKPVVPFPNRLVNPKPNAHMEKIREMFNQVQINVPLLDAIQQVPSYAKFLKEMCTKKRKAKVPKKVFLASNISELLTGPIPVKYKDPGSPTISCIIGQTTINRALLDLGASINLLPFSVYQQLGLGDLRPTQVRIQLADRSVKIPKGEIHDVLIRVGEFIYPVDFIVLETQPVSNTNHRVQTPVILGRPFLATANAIINCRNGSMRLTFGDMTREVNVFNMDKQPRKIKDQTFEVNFVGGNCEEESEDSKDESQFLNELFCDSLNVEDPNVQVPFQKGKIKRGKLIWISSLSKSQPRIYPKRI